MEAENVDVVNPIGESIWRFCFSAELWEDYLNESHEIDISKMKKIPYFDGDSSTLSEKIKEVPNNKGGIYIYTLENPIAPDHGRHIMYVGRARKTNNMSLRARAQSHFYQYQRGDENERLSRLYDGWAKYVYFSYIQMDSDNDVIEKVEKDLIVHLLPPCNKDYPSVKIRKKLSAFQYS